MSNNQKNPNSREFFSNNFRTLLILVIVTASLSSCDKFNRPEKIRHKDGWKEFTVNENGDSLMTIYRKDGVKKSQVTYKNGFHDGVGYNFYDDGKLKNEIHYKEGYKNGVSKWYYKTGILYRETIYQEGKKEGVQKKYYENGKLKAEIPYEDNKVQPGLKEYREDGSQIAKYPKIRFQEIDKLAFENKLILKVYLEPKGRKTKYSRIKKIEGKEYDISLSGQTKNSSAYIEYRLNPGRSVMEKVKVRVKTTTKLGNPLIIIKSYNLAIENRF